MEDMKAVARFFVEETYKDKEESLAHMKLQKLMYYAQGFYLALYDTPLFEGEIQAWRHGPVVVNLYGMFSYVWTIPQKSLCDITQVEQSTKEFLTKIFGVFGRYSEWFLSKLTHQEPLWRDNFKPNPQGRCTNLISLEQMRMYFLRRLVPDPVSEGEYQFLESHQDLLQHIKAKVKKPTAEEVEKVAEYMRKNQKYGLMEM